MKETQIAKGKGEYKKCQRCNKRFRRKKSIWNLFENDYIFCPRCARDFNEWFNNVK